MRDIPSRQATINRLIGDMPAIGIRPVIDARMGGVRESLENQTMAMAKSVASLLTNTLRYPDGRTVRCVIADSTIGRVAESAACAEKFRKENVGLSITVTPCWCYGAETMDMDPLIPKAIWGFNGTERPGAVYLAAVLAAHTQKGLPAFGIYGREVQDASDTAIPDDVSEKLVRFARAGLAAAMMRGKSYLSIGGTSMGIAGSIVDSSFFEKYLDMRVESIDMIEVLRRIDKGIIDKTEFEKACLWTRKVCREGKDYNPRSRCQNRSEKNRTWDISIKMAIIIRDLMVGNPRLARMGFGEESLGHNALLSGFQGQRQWTDYLPNADFAEAILNSSFDWNGIRKPYLLATENDACNGVSMLFGNLLTQTAQIFADVRSCWTPQSVRRVTEHRLSGPASTGIIHLINSGAAALDGTGAQTRNGIPVIKPFWEISEKEMKACLEKVSWHAAILEYFRAGGWSSKFTTAGAMPVTMVRINMVDKLGPALQLAEGFTVDLPEKVHSILDERTNPTWPTTWFAPFMTGKGVFRDAYSVMNAWGANHGSLCYGHVGADIITLASILRIPVFMHNVDNARIFRPSSWMSFGTADLEGADFRACQAYGPLYR
jgi:L-fucose/D-arabinose isomerase